MSDQGSPARDRVCRFLAAREGMRGIDRDLIHAIGTHDGPVELTVSDLAAILTEGAAAVETVKRVEALIAGDARYVHHLTIRRAIDGPPQPDAAQVAEPAPDVAEMLAVNAGLAVPAATGAPDA